MRCRKCPTYLHLCSPFLFRCRLAVLISPSLLMDFSKFRSSEVGAFQSSLSERGKWYTTTTCWRPERDKRIVLVWEFMAMTPAQIFLLFRSAVGVCRLQIQVFEMKLCDSLNFLRVCSTLLLRQRLRSVESRCKLGPYPTRRDSRTVLLPLYREQVTRRPASNQRANWQAFHVIYC